MSSKKELLVVGDSFCIDYVRSRNKMHADGKYPYVIVNNDIEGEFKNQVHEWKYIEPFPTWGEIVAKELNLKHVCLGQSGTGSDYVFAKTLDYISKNKKKIGKIIIVWSSFARFDFELQHDPRHNFNRYWNNFDWISFNPTLLLGTTVHIEFDILKDNVIKNLKQLKALPIDAGINKFFRNAYALQTILESFNIDYNMIQSVRDWTLSIGEFENIAKLILNNQYCELINEDKFIGYPTHPLLGGFNMVEILLDGGTDSRYCKNHINEYDKHPNKNGNKLIAKRILDEIL